MGNGADYAIKCIHQERKNIKYEDKLLKEISQHNELKKTLSEEGIVIPCSYGILKHDDTAYVQVKRGWSECKLMVMDFASGENLLSFCTRAVTKLPLNLTFKALEELECRMKAALTAMSQAGFNAWDVALDNFIIDWTESDT